ncbi:GGDEF domain-containing protein [Yunchengibacter salinarum]|uniref:GGDEF domain-containing protein n=1 Tax=Yunchengibacter salinarum TaxID=3133399 RepID=UPI0035B5C7AA
MVPALDGDDPLARVVNMLPVGFLLLDGWRIVFTNREAERLFNAPESRLLQEDLRPFMEAGDRGLLTRALSAAMEEPDQHPEVNCRLIPGGKDVPARDVHLTVARLVWQGVPYTQMVVQDISREKAREHELERLSLTDPLTGAYNRRAFADHVAEAGRTDVKDMAVILFDIDHFKVVNDQHGHAAGDMVLIHLVTLAQARVRAWNGGRSDGVHPAVDAAMLARVGGEEFAILLPGADRDTARRFADQVRMDVADSSVSVDGRDVRVTISLGAAVLPTPEADLDALLRRADRALYSAKNDGRDRVILADATAPPPPASERISRRTDRG